MDASDEGLAGWIRDGDIEKDDVDGMVLERVEHGRAVRGHDRVVTDLLEDRGDAALADDVAIRDEDARAPEVKDGGGLADELPIERAARLTVARLIDPGASVRLPCRAGHADPDAAVSQPRRSMPIAHAAHHPHLRVEGR